jgi:hypothetical protein
MNRYRPGTLVKIYIGEGRLQNTHSCILVHTEFAIYLKGHYNEADFLGFFAEIGSS